MVLEKVRWGIIGCGNVTEVKSGPPLQLTGHSSLVAVMRRNPSLAADYARRHGVAKWYNDADKLIHDPDVNAVYVATPPDTHMDYAVRAMRAGKPVYVEKPMARNYAECAEMNRVSEETGIPLFVAYYRRSLPGFVKVRELIAGGEIGTPQQVNVTLTHPADRSLDKSNLPWRYQPAISGGGLFFDLASHTLDYLDYLFGPVENIKSNACNRSGLYDAEDTVSSDWRHSCGVSGKGEWCFCADKNIDTIEISGTDGCIRFSTFTFEPVVLENKRGSQEFVFPRPAHVQTCLMKDIVAALRGEGVSPSTGTTAARTSCVMDEMVKGYYQGISKNLFIPTNFGILSFSQPPPSL